MRPEGGRAGWGSEHEDPHATAPGAYEAAVDALRDPLTDPLPDGYAAHHDPLYDPYHPAPYDAAQGYAPGTGAGTGEYETGRIPDPYAPTGGDWFDAGSAPATGYPPRREQYEPYPAPGGPAETQPADAYAADPYAAEAYAAETYTADAYPAGPEPYPDGPGAHDPETIGLRRPDDLRAAGAATATAALDTVAAPETGSAAASASASDDDPEPAPATAGGHRAARRKAEKARKATRANKIANVMGELMITTGALLMLFVTYQLWWTNVEARAHANSQARELLEGWEGESVQEPADPEGEDEGEDGGAPAPPETEVRTGDGFALLYLPTINIRVPIAEGVDEKSVLDRGLVGRYSAEDGLPTAMPWDEEGNVGLAGHRNTHGEPFRYINKLADGDPIVIETETAYYVYEVRSRLDSTAPSNIQVLDPIPTQGGFTEPGRYVTLTTCTPEFTSTYRLIVWGEMVEERPRGEGKPDALAD